MPPFSYSGLNMNEVKCDMLFIDGRNALYRSIYGGHADRSKSNRSHSQYHFFTIFLRNMADWLNRFRPTSVHMFWDAPRATVWRRKILPTYKNREKSDYVRDISADLEITTQVAHEFLDVMGVRQYERACMEADDLIYAATCNAHPRNTVIVSTDSDMTQIPYKFHSSVVYHPKRSVEITAPEHDPCIMKSVVGDTADTIPGYKGIGPVNGAKMCADPQVLNDYLNLYDRYIFKRNMVLVDLSLCPSLPANRFYVMKKMAKPVVYDEKAIRELVLKHKVNGIDQEFNNIIRPFGKLK